MLYQPELFYFFDQKDFAFEKSVLVISKFIAKSCTHYTARLITPKRGEENADRAGVLPEGEMEKDKFIEELLTWVFKNSQTYDFKLLLDNAPIGTKKAHGSKFDHRDDTCCWFLNINEQEFSELKKELVKNNLPEDLFYPESAAVIVPIKPNWFDKFLSLFGITSETENYYTPLRWKNKSDKNINKS